MKIKIDDTKFLNRDQEIAHKQIVKIAGEGVWEESPRFKKEDGTPQNQFSIKLEVKPNEIRKTTLNFGNVKLLVEAFGDETKDWVGKELRAWKTKSEKAKNGFTFLYVPTDWERDDTGEWIKSETASIGLDTIEYPEDEYNGEMPNFDLPEEN